VYIEKVGNRASRSRPCAGADEECLGVFNRRYWLALDILKCLQNYEALPKLPAVGPGVRRELAALPPVGP